MPDHHALSVHKQVGALTLSADLRLPSPWTILFGPSGSGKSSLLRAAAGLLGRTGIEMVRHENGTAHILQSDTIFTPPHLRRMSWAPQHTSLFPHLTVRENLTFASDATQPPTTLQELIALFRLSSLLDRRPVHLSGGERQRVNLARAFSTPHCRLLLLDEPFTGFDRALRDELLPQMRAWLFKRSIPVLSVTHDVDEAFQLQAEIVLLHEGRIKAQGPVREVLAEERDRQLAALSFR